MTEKDAVATAETISAQWTKRAMSNAIVLLMDTESAMSNALNIGADDGRKIVSGTEKGTQMTDKEAINAIFMASTYNGCGQYTSDELKEAKKLAYIALEKQIPRMPTRKKREGYGGYIRYTDYYCPVCSKQQKCNFNSKRKEDGWHCERCGQKLRWGD